MSALHIVSQHSAVSLPHLIHSLNQRLFGEHTSEVSTQIAKDRDSVFSNSLTPQTNMSDG